MEMNAKERVKVALSRQVPDKVPLGEFAIDSDTAARVLGHETYARAKAKCQIGYWDGRRDEVVQSLIEDTIALYRKLDLFDIINVAATTLGLVPPKGYRPEAPRRVDETTWEFPDGRLLKYSDVTQDLTLVYDPDQWTRPIQTEDFPEDPPEYREPDPSVYDVVDGVVSALGEERFIFGPFPQAEEWVQPGGMERSLVLMAEQPDLVEQALRSSLARARQEQNHWVSRGYDGVLNGTDWAYRSGPFMSPGMWRRFCYPALVANVQAAHEAGLYFAQHACGNNWPILEGFMEAGVDVYQSVQGSAGMGLERVREATRGRMALWGGVAVENLVSGTPEDVRQDVRAAMAIANSGGGFVLGSSHSIAVGTRYENFMAMLDEFDRLRG